MECRGKLQSHNQVIASKDLSPSTWLEILYFLFADATDRRHFAGAAAASRSQLVGAPAVKNTRRTTADSWKPAQTTTPHAGAHA